MTLRSRTELKQYPISKSEVWLQVKSDIVVSDEGFVVFDDTVLDKSHSRHIESVRWQYSGNAHGVIRGIGLVNCIYVNPETEQFWVIDFRIFDPEKDGKGLLTKEIQFICYRITIKNEL